jgi:hypothetical protein
MTQVRGERKRASEITRAANQGREIEGSSEAKYSLRGAHSTGESEPKGPARVILNTSTETAYVEYGCRWERALRLGPRLRHEMTLFCWARSIVKSVTTRMDALSWGSFAAQHELIAMQSSQAPLGRAAEPNWFETKTRLKCACLFTASRELVNVRLAGMGDEFHILLIETHHQVS